MTTDAWYDEQKRLTPDQLQAVTFPLTRWGRHGYDEEPVRAFLAEVHAEMVRLINERASLWQEVQRLRRRILGKETGQRSDPVRQGRRAHACRADPLRAPSSPRIGMSPTRRPTAGG